MCALQDSGPEVPIKWYGWAEGAPIFAEIKDHVLAVRGAGEHLSNLLIPCTLFLCISAR